MTEIIVKCIRHDDTTHALVSVHQGFYQIAYGVVDSEGLFNPVEKEVLWWNEHPELKGMYEHCDIFGAWDMDMLNALLSPSGQPEEVAIARYDHDEVSINVRCLTDSELDGTYKSLTGTCVLLGRLQRLHVLPRETTIDPLYISKQLWQEIRRRKGERPAAAAS